MTSHAPRAWWLETAPYARRKPHALASTPATLKEKHPFLFQKKSTPAKIRKARNIFSFWGCRVKRGGGGTIRAYEAVSSHHALRTWHISDFGNRCEFGTIQTPRKNKRLFKGRLFFS